MARKVHDPSGFTPPCRGLHPTRCTNAFCIVFSQGESRTLGGVCRSLLKHSNPLAERQRAPLSFSKRTHRNQRGRQTLGSVPALRSTTAGTDNVAFREQWRGTAKQCAVSQLGPRVLYRFIPGGANVYGDGDAFNLRFG